MQMTSRGTDQGRREGRRQRLDREQLKQLDPGWEEHNSATPTRYPQPSAPATTISHDHSHLLPSSLTLLPTNSYLPTHHGNFILQNLGAVQWQGQCTHSHAVAHCSTSFSSSRCVLVNSTKIELRRSSCRALLVTPRIAVPASTRLGNLPLRSSPAGGSRLLTSHCDLLLHSLRRLSCRRRCVF